MLEAVSAAQLGVLGAPQAAAHTPTCRGVEGGTGTPEMGTYWGPPFTSDPHGVVEGVGHMNARSPKGPPINRNPYAASQSSDLGERRHFPADIWATRPPDSGPMCPTPP